MNMIQNSIIISLELSTMDFLQPFPLVFLKTTNYKNNHPSTREWQIGTKERN